VEEPRQYPLNPRQPPSPPILPAGVAGPLDDQEFVLALEPVISAVRDALAAVVDAMPAPVRNAADLRRILTIDTRLSTQIVRIARAPDGASVAAHVPGRPSFSRFLERAGAVGIAPALLRRVDAAVAEFERFVADHATDRVSFNSIVANLGAHGREAIQLEHRRAAFRAMSHLLGMQMDAYTRACLMRLSPDGDAIDVVQVYGFLGIRRLRPQTVIPLFSAKLVTTNQLRFDERHRRSAVFDEISPGFGFGLVPGVNSQDLSEIHLAQDNGLVSAELRGSRLGSQGSLDLFFVAADYNVFSIENYAVDARQSPGNSIGLNHGIVIPAKAAVLDFITPPGLVAPATTHGAVYMNRGGRFATVYRPEDIMDIHSSVSALDPLADDDPVLAPHRAALQWVMEAISWPVAKSLSHRMHVDYPVVGTLLRLGTHLSTQNTNK